MRHLLVKVTLRKSNQSKAEGTAGVPVLKCPSEKDYLSMNA